MATSRKRKHEDNDNEIFTLKKSDVQKLNNFIKWCDTNDFKISSKVKVGHEGSCAQIGMVAVEDIPEGYCLFQVPRTCLIMPENSCIAQIIEEEKSRLSSSNQWIPLLITLLYEKYNDSSKWKPYLDLFPNHQSLDLPIFWTRSDINTLLKGTGVDLASERDLTKIQSDFETLVLPFLQKHSQKFRENEDGLQEFKKLVAFVMAYSFTEPQSQSSMDPEDDDSSDEEGEAAPMAPPMMVPLADSLNHVTDHNAKLTFGQEALKMVAARDIKKGEEIFNTYGEVSNLHLMHMYGFAEKYPANKNDVVEIPVERMLAAARILCEDIDLVKEQWNFLREQEIIVDDDIFVLNRDGFVTDEICLQALKVLTMSKEYFTDYVEKEGWSDAESDSSVSDDSKLEFVNLPNLEPKWKKLLTRMALLHLSCYPTSLEDDEKLLSQASDMPPRLRYSLYTRHGQQKLLQMLIDACAL